MIDQKHTCNWTQICIWVFKKVCWKCAPLASPQRACSLGNLHESMLLYVQLYFVICILLLSHAWLVLWWHNAPVGATRPQAPLPNARWHLKRVGFLFPTWILKKKPSFINFWCPYVHNTWSKIRYYILYKDKILLKSNFLYIFY